MRKPDRKVGLLLWKEGLGIQEKETSFLRVFAVRIVSWGVMAEDAVFDHQFVLR